MRAKYTGFILWLVLAVILLLPACSNNIDSSAPGQPTGSTSSALPVADKPSFFGVVSLLYATDTATPDDTQGPLVELTLRNINGEPLVALSAAILPDITPVIAFHFDFGVSPDNPLPPGETASATVRIGKYDDGTGYSLIISGKNQSGDKFEYYGWQITLPYQSGTTQSTYLQNNHR
jgi:hypothetical protein